MRKNNDTIKVSIKIECETNEEILSHLNVIGRNIKKEIRKRAADKAGFDGDMSGYKSTDDNCYGIHKVQVS